MESCMEVLQGTPFSCWETPTNTCAMSDTWRGMVERNSPPELNLSGVLLMDLCDYHGLITNMFKHKYAH